MAVCRVTVCGVTLCDVRVCGVTFCGVTICGVTVSGVTARVVTVCVVATITVAVVMMAVAVAVAVWSATALESHSFPLSLLLLIRNRPVYSQHWDIILCPKEVTLSTGDPPRSRWIPDWAPHEALLFQGNRTPYVSSVVSSLPKKSPASNPKVLTVRPNGMGPPGKSETTIWYLGGL